MTMQQALATLSERLTDLDEALDHLSWAVVQDQPPADGAPSPAGHLDDMTQAMRGWVAEAKQVIAGRQGSAAILPPLPAVRRALVICQRLCLQTAGVFHEQLMAADNESALRQLARGQDPDWRRWAHGVRDALEQCRAPLHAVNEALLQCWQELSELVDPPSVTISQIQSGYPDRAPALVTPPRQ